MSWDIVLMKTHTNSEPLDANINFVPLSEIQPSGNYTHCFPN